MVKETTFMQLYEEYVDTVQVNSQGYVYRYTLKEGCSDEIKNEINKVFNRPSIEERLEVLELMELERILGDVK